jgi:O-phosphoseryl-tRNA(Cys) synthetase
MIKKEIFMNLTYEEKKQALIDIFGQIKDEEIDFDDVIFLLNASSKIKDDTLNQIYNNLFDLLQNAKNISQKIYLGKLKNIEKKIQEDVEKDSKEADSLLNNI